jgi:hypothetical protein
MNEPMPKYLSASAAKLACLKLNAEGVRKMRTITAMSSPHIRDIVVPLCDTAEPIADRLHAFCLGIIASHDKIDTDEQLLSTIEREAEGLAATLTQQHENLSDAIMSARTILLQIIAWINCVVLMDHAFNTGEQEQGYPRIVLRDRVERRTRRHG